MKKNTVKAIFLGILALVIVAGFSAEIVLAAGRAAPWYIFFWSILTPVVALYFVIKRLLSVLKMAGNPLPNAKIRRKPRIRQKTKLRIKPRIRRKTKLLPRTKNKTNRNSPLKTKAD